jgi:hypothetical protein
LEGIGIDGNIILKWIPKIGLEDLDWIDLAQDRYRWHAVVNVVINFQVP